MSYLWYEACGGLGFCPSWYPGHEWTPAWPCCRAPALCQNQRCWWQPLLFDPGSAMARTGGQPAVVSVARCVDVVVYPTQSLTAGRDVGSDKAVVVCSSHTAPPSTRRAVLRAAELRLCVCPFPLRAAWKCFRVCLDVRTVAGSWFPAALWLWEGAAFLL